MFLLQIAQAPVVIQIQDGDMPCELVIPKYKLKDATEWGAVISSRWVDQATEGLNDNQRREYLAAYPPIPPTLDGLKQLLRTVPGIQEVLETAIPRARVWTLTQKTKSGGKDDKGKDKPPVRYYVREKEITSPEALARVLASMLDVGTGSLGFVARQIADLDETALSRITPEKDDSGTEAPNPLTSPER